MKPLESVILSALLFFVCVSPIRIIKAEESAVNITVDSAEAEPGAAVSISIRLSGNYSATALTLMLEYDPELLQLSGSLKRGEVWNEVLSVGGMAMSNIQNAGRILFSAISYDFDSYFSSSGTLFTANFTVSSSAAPGTVIPLILTVSQFTLDEIDGSIELIPFTAYNGSVTVTGEPANVGIPGDVDCSGTVDMSDVSMLFSYLNGGGIQISEDGLVNADANKDGSVSVMDITAIFEMISNS